MRRAEMRNEPEKRIFNTMENTAQMCGRLIVALEDLTAQEAVSLETRDFAALISIQDRAAPLVELLAAKAAEISDPALRARLAALHARRSRTGEWLSVEIELAREQLGETHAAQRRIAQVAPAYGRPIKAAPRNQLCAVG